jgi:hypothetical protein
MNLIADGTIEEELDGCLCLEGVDKLDLAVVGVLDVADGPA